MLELTNTQKADLFKVVQQSQLLPSLFKLGTRDADWLHWEDSNVPSLIYQPNQDFYFTFGKPAPMGLVRTPVAIQDVPYSARFVPGKGAYLEEHTRLGWEGLLDLEERWLRQVHLEISTSDPWAVLGSMQPGENLTVSTDKLDNSPFTPAELDHVDSEVGKLSERIQAIYDLTGGQTLILQSVMEEVRAGSKRLGRFDFKNVFLGIMIEWFFQAMVPPQAQAAVGKAIMAAFQAIAFGLRLTP